MEHSESCWYLILQLCHSANWVAILKWPQWGWRGMYGGLLRAALRQWSFEALTVCSLSSCSCSLSPPWLCLIPFLLQPVWELYQWWLCEWHHWEQVHVEFLICLLPPPPSHVWFSIQNGTGNSVVLRRKFHPLHAFIKRGQMKTLAVTLSQYFTAGLGNSGGLLFVYYEMFTGWGRLL